MRKKGYRGVRCVKQHFDKCEGICKTYDKIQTAYARELQKNSDIVSFQSNVQIESPDGTAYTSDFVATRSNGKILVRECVWRKHLSWPTVAKLLDMSRSYWLSKGVEDWGIVIEKEDVDEGE